MLSILDTSMAEMMTSSCLPTISVSVGGREGGRGGKEGLIVSFIKLYTVLKYIGYYAELPIDLPKEMEDKIVAQMQETSVGQGTACGYVS